MTRFILGKNANEFCQDPALGVGTAQDDDAIIDGQIAKRGRLAAMPQDRVRADDQAPFDAVFAGNRHHGAVDFKNLPENTVRRHEITAAEFLAPAAEKTFFRTPERPMVVLAPLVSEPGFPQPDHDAGLERS